MEAIAARVCCRFIWKLGKKEYRQGVFRIVLDHLDVDHGGFWKRIPELMHASYNKPYMVQLERLFTTFQDSRLEIGGAGTRTPFPSDAIQGANAFSALLSNASLEGFGAAWAQLASRKPATDRWRGRLSRLECRQSVEKMMCKTFDLEKKWCRVHNYTKVGHVYPVQTLPREWVYSIENTRLSLDQIYCIQRGSGIAWDSSSKHSSMFQSRLAESYHASHKLFGGAGSVWMASLLRHYYPGVTHFGALGPEETSHTKRPKPSFGTALLFGNESSKGKEPMHD